MINVLITDDDKLARIGLANTIHWADYNMQVVGQASNGRKALEIIELERVDLVFVDIGMPVMNGLELIRRCRKEHPEVRFVVLSFHEDFKYIQEALRLGVLDYISKEQTEQDDYGSIMDRIVSRMNGQQDESDQDASEVRGLEQRIERPLWIFDHLEFGDILQMVEKSEFRMRSAERAYVAAISHLGTQMQVNLGEIQGIKDAYSLKEALRSERNFFQESILAQNDTSYSRMLSAAQYVWKNYNSAVSSREVANAIGFSRSHFSVLFRDTVGIQFSLFLRRERIRNAVLLMRDTKLSQAAIADKVGYMDIKNYTAAFGTVIGCSPGEYRIKIQNGLA